MSAARTARARQAAQSKARQRRAVYHHPVLLGMAVTAAGTALAIYAVPTFVIVFGGMLPAFTAYLLDDQPGRQLFRTVGTMNLAGVIPYIEPTWRLGPALGIVGYPVADLSTWIVIYGSACAGFAMAWALPIAANALLNASLQARLTRTEEARRALEAEWNLESDAGAKS